MIQRKGVMRMFGRRILLTINAMSFRPLLVSSSMAGGIYFSCCVACFLVSIDICST